MLVQLKLYANLDLNHLLIEKRTPMPFLKNNAEDKLLARAFLF